MKMNGNFADHNTKENGSLTNNMKKIGPVVPPKQKKKITPEIPQSCHVKQICEPLYSKRLQSLETPQLPNVSQFNVNSSQVLSGLCPILQKKHQTYLSSNNLYDKSNKVTLDNPAILEQQLEALAYHKKQLEKKGLLLNKEKRNDVNKSPLQTIPKLSSTSFVKHDKKNTVQPNSIYANLNSSTENWREDTDSKIYSNLCNYEKKQTLREHATSNYCDKNSVTISNTYGNPESTLNPHKIKPSLNLPTNPILVSVNDGFDNNTSSPPSPVSSSYSELRRATNCKKEPAILQHKNYSGIENYGKFDGNSFSNYSNLIEANNQTYMNIDHNSDYSRYSPILQGSSNYESIYEPIHPRPPSQLSSRSPFLLFAPYNEIEHIRDSGSGLNSSATELKKVNDKEAEVEALTDLLVQTLDTGNDIDSYGICYNCNQPVLGENSGCTAMDHVYHISCFTCSQCHINLQGKPFYSLEGKPYCEHDYLQTLEKCSVCVNPILERILRATGKPYHPQCFTCIVCGNSLDGIPFTVDATNQNYCIEDFHKKFAPRCCVCKEPIMPEVGEEETIRVVALDRSFHFECYKCEDCGLLLSSEAEGRGCYPLDDHVLCKSCNAKRVQMLTNKMITEL